jgi:hypothetical protein
MFEESGFDSWYGCGNILHSVQTAFEDHPAAYPVLTRDIAAGA